MAMVSFINGTQPTTAASLAAQARAEEQASAGYIWHDLSTYQSDPSVCGVGEILAAGLAPYAAMDRWWASPGHHDVIVQDYWDTAAVGGSGGVLVVVFEAHCKT
jgi:uncharacterized protein YkwD